MAHSKQTISRLRVSYSSGEQEPVEGASRVYTAADLRSKSQEQRRKNPDFIGASPNPDILFADSMYMALQAKTPSKQPSATDSQSEDLLNQMVQEHLSTIATPSSAAGKKAETVKPAENQASADETLSLGVMEPKPAEAPKSSEVQANLGDALSDLLEDCKESHDGQDDFSSSSLLRDDLPANAEGPSAEEMKAGMLSAAELDALLAATPIDLPSDTALPEDDSGQTAPAAGLDETDSELKQQLAAADQTVHEELSELLGTPVEAASSPVAEAPAVEAPALETPTAEVSAAETKVETETASATTETLADAATPPAAETPQAAVTAEPAAEAVTTPVEAPVAEPVAASSPSPDAVSTEVASTTDSETNESVVDENALAASVEPPPNAAPADAPAATDASAETASATNTVTASPHELGALIDELTQPEAPPEKTETAPAAAGNAVSAQTDTSATPKRSGSLAYNIFLTVAELLDLPFGWVSTHTKQGVGIAGLALLLGGLLLMMMAWMTGGH